MKQFFLNNIRAISVGALVWVCIFIAFSALSYLPVIKDSLDKQALIVAVLIVPFAVFGASIYYKNGNKGHGLKVGLIMVATAFFLDALITVPLMEIPNGRGYQSFFTYPLLYLLAAVNVLSVYLYWRLRTKIVRQ
jgi:hypothetical protein